MFPKFCLLLMFIKFDSISASFDKYVRMEIPNETFVQLDVKYHIISEMQCGLVCSNNVDCNGFQFQDSVCTLFQQAADFDLLHSTLSGNLTPVFVHESQLELLSKLS